MPTDHAGLRRLARAVIDIEDACLSAAEVDERMAAWELATTPETILPLLDEIEALRREVDEWQTRYRQRLRDLE